MLERFFGFTDRRTLNFLEERGRYRENVGYGLILGDGLGGEVVVVHRGVIGVGVVFSTAGERLVADDVRGKRQVPLVNIYGSDEVVLDLFISGNVNFFTEVLSLSADVTIIPKEAFSFALRMDGALLDWFFRQVSKIVSTYGLLFNLRFLPARQRITAVKSLFPSIPKKHLARLLGLTRETVSRQLNRKYNK